MKYGIYHEMIYDLFYVNYKLLKKCNLNVWKSLL